MKWRNVRIGVAVLLVVAICCVIIDGFYRASTISILSNDIENPPHDVVQNAEWNVAYVYGLIIGTGTGITAAVACYLWWRIANRRR